MINIDHIETWGWEAAFRGMRNPLNSWQKSDSFFDELLIGKNDLDLAKRLIKAGSEHRKFLRMIHVQMDITAPLYWVAEHDTYKVGTTRNSCSFMHKGTSKAFTDTDFSMNNAAVEKAWSNVIDQLNFLREQYLETKDFAYFEAIRQLLPQGYNTAYTWDCSMETILNIIHQRENHRLPEWREFCRICKERIPYCNTFYEAMKGNANEQDKD